MKALSLHNLKILWAAEVLQPLNSKKLWHFQKEAALVM